MSQFSAGIRYLTFSGGQGILATGLNEIIETGAESGVVFPLFCSLLGEFKLG